MSERRHYPNAPIIEATISIEVVSPPSLIVTDLAEVGHLAGDHFPKMHEEHYYAGEVRVGEPGAPPEHDDVHEHRGYSFLSEDERREFDVQIDGYSFSVKGPYDRWESFRDEARSIWDLYKKVTGAGEASRVALRYINRIDIPGSRVAPLDRYFRTYLEIPDNWPGGTTVHNFFLQFQMPQTDLDCTLVVNQAPAYPPEEGMVSIRLDFDLFKEKYGNPWEVEDDSEVWDFLEKLHDRKNEVFEASITDDTRRLIE